MAKSNSPDASGWFGEDFGQKNDLTVRIREILRNYPEGTSILKELIQNSDDAGARDVKFCLDLRIHGVESLPDPSLSQFQGPALLAYNSAVFTDLDFESIQRIGDSLKKDSSGGSKTGRFGIGFNSIYHLTELPSFVSADRWCSFDPQARFLPNVNPANPGKTLRFKENASTFERYLDQFSPICAFGNDCKGRFEGTLFRFPFRTKEQAETSKLSIAVHTVESVRELMQKFIEESVSMLLFLKNVERLSVYEWKEGEAVPQCLHETFIKSPTDSLRSQRAFALSAVSQAKDAKEPITCDYLLEVTSQSNVQTQITPFDTAQKWIICNQLGGPRANALARDPACKFMQFVPLVGVAACLSGLENGGLAGKAYCFLPLPVSTGLPVHINGYFELSSNRRNIWSGDDMAGDGRIRALWNRALVEEIAPSCYTRLLLMARPFFQQNPLYYNLWPSLPGAPNSPSSIWLECVKSLLILVRNQAVLWTDAQKGVWVSPEKAVLLGPILENSPSDEKILRDILYGENVPLVDCNRDLQKGLALAVPPCAVATPGWVREFFKKRETDKILSLKEGLHDNVLFLLRYCLRDLVNSGQFGDLAGLSFVPLADGSHGRFEVIMSLHKDHASLRSMGFSEAQCIRALRKYDTLEQAANWLLTGGDLTPDKSPRAYTGVPYLLSSPEEVQLLQQSSRRLINEDTLTYPSDGKNRDDDEIMYLRRVFRSPSFQATVNVTTLRPDFLPDLVAENLPKEWQGPGVSFSWTPGEGGHPSIKWFKNLWRYISTRSPETMQFFVEKLPIVPTNEGKVCVLSLRSAIVASEGLDCDIRTLLANFGALTLLDNLFEGEEIGKKVVPPTVLYTYVRHPDRSGILALLDGLRRSHGDVSFSKMLTVGQPLQFDKLRALLCHEPVREMTGEEKGVAARLPIWIIHPLGTDLLGESKGSAATVYRAISGDIETLNVVLEKGGLNFSIENSSDPNVDDAARLVGNDAFLMTPKFLKVDGLREEAEIILAKHLGVHVISRADFYANHILNRLHSFPPNLRIASAVTLLLELPHLAQQNPRLRSLVANKALVSMADGSLSCASQLFDPEIVELQGLIPPNRFPTGLFTHPDVLSSLRSLGLRGSLSWVGIVEAATSVQELHAKDPEGAADRGRRLLGYMESHALDLWPKKHPVGMAYSLFSAVKRVILDDNSEQEEHARMLQALSQLSCLEWVPVYSTLPSPLLPPYSSLNTKDSTYLRVNSQLPRVTVPLSVRPREDQWHCSSSFRILDGDVHSDLVKEAFNWNKKVDARIVASQLASIAKHYTSTLPNLIEKGGELSVEGAQRTMASIVPRIYQLLSDAVENDPETAASVSNILLSSSWLWVGSGGFVPSDRVAFSAPANAAPYLYSVPPDLACFRGLLLLLGVRDAFGPGDFCFVLRTMALETRVIQDDVEEVKPGPVGGGGLFAALLDAVAGGNTSPTPSKRALEGEKLSPISLSPAQVDLAVGMVQILSDESFRASDLEIYCPDSEGILALSTTLAYDDCPWLTKQGLAEPGQKPQGKRAPKDIRYVHPKISAGVGEKIGIKSLRRLLVNNTQDLLDFGIKSEAFGQQEDLTRRLRHILEMYPEGPSILSELVQNADDAGAKNVKIMYSNKHYGSSSLLGPKMEKWQGPSLYFYNDATFTSRDFDSLARIGQASKLDKLTTTGRFGLGFNAVYHFTDLPSFVTGDFCVIFDPHTKYVPGATSQQPGIKVRFTESDLLQQFEDQFSPYLHFGCNLHTCFQGTLFRFPLRTKGLAGESEISHASYGSEQVSELLDGFKKTAHRFLLFLRSVQRIEVYTLDQDDIEPRLQYFVEVSARSNSQWDAIPQFISESTGTRGGSKEAFYSRLARTPEKNLPKTLQTVTITFKEAPALVELGALDSAQVEGSFIEDIFLVCAQLGGGKARSFACNPQHRHLKFLPWGGVAAHLTRNGARVTELKGHAFCFLPLPVDVGLPVHVNGYFELSSNRRDIWFGEDLAGEGRRRSEWNRLLLEDVIAPSYALVINAATTYLGPGEHFLSLLPYQLTSPKPWSMVVAALYKHLQTMPVMYTELNGGTWAELEKSILLTGYDTKDSKIRNDSHKEESEVISKLHDILILENLPVVKVPAKLKAVLLQHSCVAAEGDQAFVRMFFKNRKIATSLEGNEGRENAQFLLQYSVSGLSIESYPDLIGLPFIPLADGSLCQLEGPDNRKRLLCGPVERDLFLKYAGEWLVEDVKNLTQPVCILLSNPNLHKISNIAYMTPKDVLQLMGTIFPKSWEGLGQVAWAPQRVDVHPKQPPEEWINTFWGYACTENFDPNRDRRAVSSEIQKFRESSERLKVFEGSWPLLPAVGGTGPDSFRVLLQLQGRGCMSVISPIKPHAGFLVEGFTEEVRKALGRIGVWVLDTGVLKDHVRNPLVLEYVRPCTTSGILASIFVAIFGPNSAQFLISTSSIFLQNIDPMKIDHVFRGMSGELREALRIFLRSNNQDQNLSIPCLKWLLKRLPIFPLYGNGGFSPIGENAKWLPPARIDDLLLDDRFIKIKNEEDLALCEYLEVNRMDAAEFYHTYLLPHLATAGVDAALRNVALTAILTDFKELREKEPGIEKALREFSLFSSVALISPTTTSQLLFRPDQLYDPEITHLARLLGPELFPHPDFRTPSCLSTLRLLGLRKSLNFESIIDNAKSIEHIFENSLHEISNLHRAMDRSNELLSFLDVEIERILRDLLENLDLTEEDMNAANLFLCNDFLNENKCNNNRVGVVLEVPEIPPFLIPLVENLLSIRWLPVLASSPDEILPYKKLNSPVIARHDVGVQLGGKEVLMTLCAPKDSRPTEDLWLCSSSIPVNQSGVRGTALRRVLGWNNPIPPIILGEQLLALSARQIELARLHSHESAKMVVHLNREVPRIYRFLNQILGTPELSSVLELLSDKPWIWAQNKFFNPQNMAFNCSVNLQPYLIKVPIELMDFSALLKLGGVRDSFGAMGYMDMLKELYELSLVDKNKLLSINDIILAVNVANSLATVLNQELERGGEKIVYLPSTNGTMHPSTELVYNNANWLDSATQKQLSLQLVSPRISNSNAAKLGVRSMIDVIFETSGSMQSFTYTSLEEFREQLDHAAGPVAAEIRSEESQPPKFSGTGKYEFGWLSELLEYSENIGCTGMRILLDGRTHPSESLIDPGLVSLQGPAFLLVLEGVQLSTDDLINAVRPPIGGGKLRCKSGGLPPFGRGLIGCFYVTDCIQVLSGEFLHIFDPTGSYLSSSSPNLFPNSHSQSQFTSTSLQHCTEDRQGQGRRYKLSQEDIKTRFPHQFLPFFGVPEMGIESEFRHQNFSSFKNTAVRVALRPSTVKNGVVNRFWNFRSAKKCLEKFIPSARAAFPFGVHLNHISAHIQDPDLKTSNFAFSFITDDSNGARANHYHLLSSKFDSVQTSSLLSLRRPTPPVKTSFILDVACVIGNDVAVIDQWAVSYILSPQSLREPAQHWFERNIKLGPFIGCAALLGGTRIQGRLFAGQDTTISTGFPFHIDGPFFTTDRVFGNLKKRSLVLRPDDDRNFAHMRCQEWNAKVFQTICSDLIPSFIELLSQNLQKTNKGEELYGCWPYVSRLRVPFSNLVPAELQQKLIAAPLYLNNVGKFVKISDGLLALQTITKNVQKFALQHLSLLKVPTSIPVDFRTLLSSAPKITELTPKLFRNVLRTREMTVLLGGKSTEEIMELLEYCASDSENVIFGRKKKWEELLGLRLLPLASGTNDIFQKDRFSIVTSSQLALFPHMANRFVCPRAASRLCHLFENAEFLEVLGIQKLQPHTVASLACSMLPPQWKNESFVQWHPNLPSFSIQGRIEGVFPPAIPSVASQLAAQKGEMPSIEWVAAFWREISYANIDVVNSISSWPLIPLTTGELASCSLASTIFCAYPEGVDHATKHKVEAFFSAADAQSESFDNLRSCPFELGSMSESVAVHSDSEDDEDEENFPGGVVVPNSNNLNTEPNFAEPTTVIPPTNPGRVDVPRIVQFRNILLQLGAPILDYVYFEESKWEEIRAARGGETPEAMARCVLNGLFSLRSIPAPPYACNVLSQNSALFDGPELRLRWDTLSNAQMESLLINLCRPSGPNGALALSASGAEKLKQLPVWKTMSGQYVPLTSGSFKALDQADNAGWTNHVSLPPSAKKRLLEPSKALIDVYRDMQVPFIKVDAILASMILPEYDSLSVADKADIINYIHKEWDRLKENQELIEALKAVPFIQVSDQRYVNASNLLDPRNKILSAIFEDEPEYFPQFEYSNDKWLSILEKIGMKTIIDPETFLKCTTKLSSQSNQDPVALKTAHNAKRLIADLVLNWGPEFFNDSFLRSLGSSRCIPVETPSGSTRLMRFGDTALPKDAHLAFSILPILSKDLVPPQLRWSTLGIKSPPKTEIVLQHIHILARANALDQWSYKDPPTKVFQSIYAFIEEEWPNLPEQEKRALRGVPLIPVRGRMVKASRLFFRLKGENLAPYLYEVPRAFGAFDKLFEMLGTTSAPTTKDYILLLQELQSECGGQPLNPNELGAVLRVLDLLANAVETSGSGTFSGITGDLLVVDSNSTLVPKNFALFNDARWLFGRVKSMRVSSVHPKVSKSTCVALSIPCASDVIQEHLQIGFTPSAYTSETTALSQSDLTNTLNSIEFSNAVQSLVISQRDEFGSKESSMQSDFTKQLDLLKNLTVLYVRVLRTRFMLSVANGGEEDITSSSEGSLFFIDRPACRLLIAIPLLPPSVSPAHVVGMAVSQILHLPPTLSYHMPALLSAKPCQIASILSPLRLGEEELVSHELSRGVPGRALLERDINILQLKPTKTYIHNEIAAVQDKDGVFRYVVIVNDVDSDEIQTGSGATSVIRYIKLRKSVGSEPVDMLATEVYSFKNSKSSDAGSLVSSLWTSRPVYASTVNEDRVGTELAKEPKIAPSIGPGEVVDAINDILSRLQLSLTVDQDEYMRELLQLREETQSAKEIAASAEQRAEQAEQELAATNEAWKCKICYSSNVEIILLPCGHLTCPTCPSNFRGKCPFCRNRLIGQTSIHR